MQDLHYFPGHMKKTQRAIEESIKKVDGLKLLMHVFRCPAAIRILTT